MFVLGQSIGGYEVTIRKDDEPKHSPRNASQFGKRFRSVPAYTVRQNEIFEVTARLPEQLSYQSIITHFPIYNRTTKDERLLCFKKHLIERTRGKFDPANASQHLADLDQSVFSRVMEAWEENSETHDILPSFYTNISPLLQKIYAELLAFSARLTQYHCELFIFRCESYILIQLNRCAHDYVIREISKDERRFLENYDIAQHRNGVFVEIRRLTNLIVSDFFVWLRNLYLTREFVQELDKTVRLEKQISTGEDSFYAN